MIRRAAATPRRLTPYVSTARSRSRYIATLGIRREDPRRIWERRAPLTPDDLAKLLSAGGSQVRAEVESCARRCFTDADYAHAGAAVVPALGPEVDLVLGVKEPPVAEVQALEQASPGRKRSYMVFSHTHKGQIHNAPLLSTFVNEDGEQSLIDYELLTAPVTDGDGVVKQKRVAAFGWFAGAVGAGEALSMTGLALLRRGIATPLLHLPRPYTFGDLQAYKAGLRRIGDLMLSSLEVPGRPLVIGLTGAGSVSTGAREMLDAFGVQWVQPEQLRTLGNGTRVYACQILPPAYLQRVDGQPYDRSDYRRNPSAYQSVFADQIAPHLTTLINGAAWQQGCPRLLSTDDMARMHQKQERQLMAIQDIVCDLHGGIEFVTSGTTIDTPHYEGPGQVLVSSIDILPTELPIDASTHFSAQILPYVHHLVSPASRRIGTSSAAALGATIERATIVKDGVLTEPHQSLQHQLCSHLSTPRSEPESRSQRRHLSLKNSRTAQPAPAAEVTSQLDGPNTRDKAGDRRLGVARRRVLLLGSGLVAAPAVEVFSARSDILLYIGSNNAKEARSLAASYPNVETFGLDVSDAAALEQAVSQADVVVSLLPAPMHVPVAEQCIRHGKHLVTASYISPEMKALHHAAQEADVILLGECGLDPGIDSMAAMRILDRVKREGKIVKSFVSWCGGLPEPAASNQPFGYKFSWSPKAVLTAALNVARYKLEGEIMNVAGPDLLQRHFPRVELWKGLALEGLANRDALPYAEKYGLGEVNGLTDLFRGTLRYQGFSRLLESFRKVGLLGTQPITCNTPLEWSTFFLGLLQGNVGQTGSRAFTLDDVPYALRDLLGEDQARETLDALYELRLMPTPETFFFSGPVPRPAPIDFFAEVLSRRLKYAPGERDTCLLHHTFLVAPASFGGAQGMPATAPLQKITASLMHYGTAHASSMATTVGKTLAFAALRVTDGQVKGRGVRGPYEREVWEGVLDRLEHAGVKVEERGWTG